MARRTKGEAELTRSAILDAAELVFYKSGVARTSLQEVAAAAGFTRGAVYWHFKNKIELLDAMVKRVILPQEAIIEQLVASDTATPLDDLCCVCRDVVKQIFKDDRRRRVFIIITQRCEYMADLALLLERRRESKARMLGRFVTLFERARKLKMLNPNWQPQVAAMTLQGLIIGLLMNGLEQEHAVDFSDTYVDCITTFFKSVGV